MKNVFIREIARSIKNSLGRFFAIVVIVAIGCGFFAGLRMTGTGMRKAADAYYDGTNLYDLQLVSTLGLTQSTIDLVADTPGVTAIAPSRSVDVMAALGEGQYACRITSFDVEAAKASTTDDGVHIASDDDDYINRLVLRSGRWPEKNNECVVLEERAEHLGDASSVRVLYGASDVSDLLAQMDYTIVGTVSSTFYTSSSSLATTTLGSGILQQAVYVPMDAFKQDAPYTECFMKVGSAASEVTATEGYQAQVDGVAELLEGRLDEVASDRHEEIRKDAQETLDEKRTEYEDEKAKALKELDDAKAELDDAYTELADGQKQVDDAKAELAQGQAEYDDGVAELAASREKLEDGESQWQAGNDELASGEAQLADAKDQLAAAEAELGPRVREFEAAEAQYESGLSQYESGLASYEEGIASWRAGTEEIVSAGQAFAPGATTPEEVQAALPGIIAKLENALAAAEQGGGESPDTPGGETPGEGSEGDGSEGEGSGSGGSESDGAEVAVALASTPGSAVNPEVERLKQQLAQAQSFEATLESQIPQLNAAKERLDAAKAELDAKKPELDAAEEQLNAARPQITSAQSQLADAQEEVSANEAKIAEGRAELDASRAELDSGWAQLNDGQAELDQARIELANGRTELKKAQNEVASGWQEYYDGKDTYDREYADAMERLDDAEQELKDAQKDIDDLEKPDVFVLDRTKNYGAASYKNDSERIDAIGSVFPFFFFVVAALVALTTMTRMVDDDRGLIGTYKALGFSPLTISAKYLSYALIASGLGAVIGIVIMSQLLPWVIPNAYSIVYRIPPRPFPLPIEPGPAFAALGLGVGCTLVATLASCLSSLRESPAALMQPKTPKAGRRILLERAKPIWRRLSFSWKVTMRNIFRYKRRFLMTVIGIAGCTGLLVTGFGVRDAISDIIDIQYGEILHHDVVVGLSQEATTGELNDVKAYLEDTGATGELVVADDENIVLRDASGEGRDRNVQLICPEDPAQFKEMRTLRTRLGHEDVPLEPDSVILTEKLATTMGVGPGSEVLLYEPNEAGNVVGEGTKIMVTGVVENYLQAYLYIGQEAYHAAFGKSPSYDTIFTTMSNDAELRKEISQHLQEMPDVDTVVFEDELIGTYSTMLHSMDLVMLVLIVSAAALAFVVLYNLANINISERVREIASLKVLGFTRREVDAYVFREILIIVCIGALVGLVLGYFFESYVVVTAEVDAAMFGREIHPLSYLYSFALTMAFSGLVLLTMVPKLNHIDMVESLKSVE